MRPRWADLAALAMVGVAVAAELWAAVRPPLSPVAPEHVAEAAAFVAERRTAQEAVLHSPLLAPEELSGLGELEAQPVLPPARLRRARIWIIDRDGVEMYVPETVRTSHARFGGVHVWAAEPADPADGRDRGPVFDLYRDLGPGMMRIERPEGKVVSVCERRRPGHGYACPGQAEWIHASRHEAMIDGKTRSCVWAHPVTEAVVVFELPPPPPVPGAKLELVVGAGLSDQAVQTPRGAVVRTRVRQDGRRSRALSVPNRQGWFERRLRVVPGEPIRISITTEDDGVRHHCINATIQTVEDSS